jgi:plasmid stability protein
VAQFIVRNIEDIVVTRLKRRAEQRGCSLGEEVRSILRAAVSRKRSNRVGLGTEIASLFREIGLDREIAEFHGAVSVGAEKVIAKARGKRRRRR